MYHYSIVTLRPIKLLRIVVGFSICIKKHRLEVLGTRQLCPKITRKVITSIFNQNDSYMLEHRYTVDLESGSLLGVISGPYYVVCGRSALCPLPTPTAGNRNIMWLHDRINTTTSWLHTCQTSSMLVVYSTLYSSKKLFMYFCICYFAGLLCVSAIDSHRSLDMIRENTIQSVSKDL